MLNRIEISIDHPRIEPGVSPSLGTIPFLGGCQVSVFIACQYLLLLTLVRFPKRINQPNFAHQSVVLLGGNAFDEVRNRPLLNVKTIMRESAFIFADTPLPECPLIIKQYISIEIVIKVHHCCSKLILCSSVVLYRIYNKLK